VPTESEGVVKGDNHIAYMRLLAAWSNIHLRHAESIIGHRIMIE
jgi:hypothetical protein